MNERLVVVHNLHSTRAKRVGHNVLDRLDDAGRTYEELIPRSPKTDDNIADMRGFFREGDTILSAAGDGTATQVANAVLRERHEDTKVGFLAYGNFNDLAGKVRDPLKLLDEAREVDIYPLVIDVNEKYWRHAPAYMTMGFTALAAEQFGDEAQRVQMQHMPEAFKTIASMAQLGRTYFEHRKQKLPPFSTSQSPIVRSAVTDVLFLNGQRTGKIIKSEDFGPTGVFGYKEVDVSTVPKNIPFGLQALVGKAPMGNLDSLDIEFVEPAKLPVQTEGEFVELEEVTRLRVSKDPEGRLRVLRPTL